jgi:dolichyl-phosphate beta-glucosyltransferase
MWEVLVVDDGGGDFPADAWLSDHRIRLVSLSPNQGKGAAVKAGVLAATGRVRVYTDVDLPYGARLIPAAADYVLHGGFHLVVGDRNLREARHAVDLGLSRRALSAVSKTFVGVLVTGGYFDTQCGFKAIRGDVADLLFPMLRIRRFAFDVELVYLALRFNCDVKRIPVSLMSSQEDSTVRPVRDGFRSGLDVLGIKGRSVRGQYECAPLQELIHREFLIRLEKVGVEPG